MVWVVTGPCETTHSLQLIWSLPGTPGAGAGGAGGCGGGGGGDPGDVAGKGGGKAQSVYAGLINLTVGGCQSHKMESVVSLQPTTERG